MQLSAYEQEILLLDFLLFASLFRFGGTRYQCRNSRPLVDVPFHSLMERGRRLLLEKVRNAGPHR